MSDSQPRDELSDASSRREGGLSCGHTAIVGIFLGFFGLEKKYPCQGFGNVFGMKVALFGIGLRGTIERVRICYGR